MLHTEVDLHLDVLVAHGSMVRQSMYPERKKNGIIIVKILPSASVNNDFDVLSPGSFPLAFLRVNFVAAVS